MNGSPSARTDVEKARGEDAPFPADPPSVLGGGEPGPRRATDRHPTVISRQESGMRGYQATLAKFGTAQMNRWRRTGGRKRNPTLLEIREREREAAQQKASARRSRRSSSPGGMRISEFDSTT